MDIEEFNEIVDMSEQNSDSMVKYINCVPKVSINVHNTYTRNGYVLIIDDQYKDIISPTNKNIEHKYKTYWVNIQYLNTLMHDILDTTGKYVYPMIFVNYIKQEKKVNTKIKFNNDLLLYIRIWSNQMRELSRKAIAKHKPNLYNSDIMYICYKICCELLYYYNTH